MNILRAAVLLIAVAGAPAWALAEGDLVIIGGAFQLDNRSVWDAIEENRLPGLPIGVFGTASSNPSGSANGVRDDFNNLYGAGTAIAINVSENNGGASNAATVALIESCGGFYFTGGDQRRIPRAFYDAQGAPTPGLLAIKAIHEAGGVISGSSAGAAIMSDPMISGGYSDEAVEFGATAEGSGQDGVKYMEGLGFHETAIYDQHHLARGRLGRLMVATHDLGFELGFGIDENTALHIDGETGWAEILGAMGAFVVDPSGARVLPDGSRRGYVLHYLDVGDRIHMETREVIPTGGKLEFPNGTISQRTVSSNDVFDDYEAWRIVTTMADAQQTYRATGTYPTSPDVSVPRYQLLFQQTPQTRFWRGGLHSYDNNRRAYTVTGAALDVLPLNYDFSASDRWVIRD